MNETIINCTFTNFSVKPISEISFSDAGMCVKQFFENFGNKMMPSHSPTGLFTLVILAGIGYLVYRIIKGKSNG